MRPLHLVLVSVILILAVAVAWFIYVPGASDFLAKKQTVTAPEETTEMALAYVSLPYPDDYNTTRVPGYVENLSGKKFSSITLEVQLLSPEGDKKELIEHTMYEIQPGTRATFDINAGTIGESRRAEVSIAEIVFVE